MCKFKNASLPIHLSDNVYISPDGEFALYQTYALKYLEWCLNSKITVLGFDVWLPSKPYPTVITSECFTGTATECINTIKNIDVIEIAKEKNIEPVFNIWTD